MRGQNYKYVGVRYGEEKVIVRIKEKSDLFVLD